MKLSDLAKGAARRAAMILPAALLASLLITGARQALSDVELRHGQGLLWQVQRAGSMPSYLFGTMHSTDQNVVTLPAKVAEAFFSADSLSVEVIMTQSAQMQLALSMILSDGRTLEQIVGPTLFEKLAIVGATYGLQPAQLQRLKPWALTAPAPQALGVDRHAQHAAQRAGATTLWRRGAGPDVAGRPSDAAYGSISWRLPKSRSRHWRPSSKRISARPCRRSSTTMPVSRRCSSPCGGAIWRAT